MAAGRQRGQYDSNGFLMREQRVLLNEDQIIIVSRPNRTTNTKTPRRCRPRQIPRPIAMAESNNESDKEDIRRMTLALTDQTTIEQLSRAGHAAQMKREELHAVSRRNQELQEQRAQQPQDDQEPESESEGQDDDDGDKGDEDDGDAEDSEDEDSENSDSEDESDDDEESSSSDEEEEEYEEEYEDEDDFEGFVLEFNADFQL